MRYNTASAFTAGVLSILLIFTLFSLGQAFDAQEYAACGVSSTDMAVPCSMNSPASSVPFANTRLIPASCADVSQENRLLNINVLLIAAYGNAINISGTMQPSAIADRPAELLVRLLI